MNSYDLPIFYNWQNAEQSKHNPLGVYVNNNALTNYFARYLLQKFVSVFKFENLPLTWNESYMLYTLSCLGYFAVVNAGLKYGVIPQYCSLTGYNIYYQPRSVMISNNLLPDLEGKELVLGKDCELVKLSPDFGCIMDLIYKYAAEYALITQSFDVSVINAKIAYIFSAANSKVAESLKKMVDQIQEGRPAVFIDKELLNPDGSKSWESIFNDGRGSVVINELLNALEKLDARFNTDIGIPNVNISKASGVSDAEVNANNIDTQAKISLWLDSINDGLQNANRMFNLNVTCKYRFEQEVKSNANESNTNSDGNV